MNTGNPEGKHVLIPEADLVCSSIAAGDALGVSGCCVAHRKLCSLDRSDSCRCLGAHAQPLMRQAVSPAVVPVLLSNVLGQADVAARVAVMQDRPQQSVLRPLAIPSPPSALREWVGTYSLSVNPVQISLQPVEFLTIYPRGEVSASPGAWGGPVQCSSVHSRQSGEVPKKPP